MKVNIKLRAIQPDISALIEKDLVSRKLPKCLGSMLPPLLPSFVSFEDTEILAIKGSVPENEIANISLVDILYDDKTDSLKEMIVTTAGVKQITGVVEQLAHSYTERISRCTQCTHVDVCHKLTQNYLKLIKLEEEC